MSNIKTLPLPFDEYVATPANSKVTLSDAGKTVITVTTIPNLGFERNEIKFYGDDGKLKGFITTIEVKNDFGTIGIEAESDAISQSVGVALKSSNGVFESYEYRKNDDKVTYTSNISMDPEQNQFNSVSENEYIKAISGNLGLGKSGEIWAYKMRQLSLGNLPSEIPSTHLNYEKGAIKITTDGTYAVVRDNFDTILKAYRRVDSPDLAKRGRYNQVFEEVDAASTDILKKKVKSREAIAGAYGILGITGNTAINTSMPQAVVQQIGDFSTHGVVHVEYVEGDKTNPLQGVNIVTALQKAKGRPNIPLAP